MIPIQRFREDPDGVRRGLLRRGSDAPVAAVLELDGRRRDLLAAVERGRADRNAASKEIGRAADAAERERLIAAQREMKGALDAQEDALRTVEAELDALLLEFPNLPADDVPDGGEADGLVVRSGGPGGEQPLDPAPVGERTVAPEAGHRPHWEVGEALGLIDFERGAKIAGSRFYVLREDAARLQRALIAWMLDVHRAGGWREVYVPAVVREEMLVGTGQLPKFADTMYHDAEEDFWLIPTAEVPVTNLYRDEILPADALPLRHCAYTPCFRRERMSAGRDVRGIKRGHQFDKVELVQFVAADASWAALDFLVDAALEIVRRLGLRYRVVRLAAADLGFSAAATYDIEVWAPGSGEWLEVSSASNFLDFQARRANLRYRDADGRVGHLHTLNASGVALPRILAALLELGDRGDRVEIPAALRPYLGGQTHLAPATPIGPTG